MSGTARTCVAAFLGQMEYARALDLQLKACERKKGGLADDFLLLLEHPPTITLGRNSRREHLLVDEVLLRERGVECLETDRGGDVTFHGPGQVVGYPILQLERRERDVRAYMRRLEELLIRTLAHFGIDAFRREGMTGVWTARGKIAAMGVHLTRWITRHGFALNVNTDLRFFDLIVPCGLKGQPVASMEAVLGRRVDAGLVVERILSDFESVFERRNVRVTLSEAVERICGNAGRVEVA